ncbi:MAG: AbrB/MazE/SpoVT family DNA-binding domain-containing protein [Lentisphaerae bacterium]|nr:AbrB/MazE/SpoVT family DNA-binding domain-containing protein [Lentisphaerota bacterium]
MAILKVSAKGWVVIPAECRKKYQVNPGSRVEIVDYGGGLSLVPVLARPIHAAQGLLKGRRSLTSALLRERAREKRRETVR